VPRHQNDSHTPWARANVYVLHRHTPYIALVPVFLPFPSTTRGCKGNYRLSGRSTQQDDLPSILCHPLPIGIARAQFCSGPCAASKCFRLSELSVAEFPDAGLGNSSLALITQCGGSRRTVGKEQANGVRSRKTKVLGVSNLSRWWYLLIALVFLWGCNHTKKRDA